MEKMFMQLKQDEVNYGPARGMDGRACSSCRWFYDKQLSLIHI